jgi:prepilin-type N-terminal cleavage/methylation domain-containing protein
METPAGNSSGFSLVELLVAVVIIAFTLLALCSAMVNAISANLGNELRNTAVRLTNHASYTYDSSNACLGIDTDYQKYPRPVQSVKGFQQSFNIIWNITSLSDNLRQVTITVAYRHREEHFENSAVIYKHRTL